MDPLLIIAAVLIIAGIVGSVIPVLPGPIFSFIAIILLFVSKGPDEVSFWSLGLFAVAMAGIIFLDYLAPVLGAKFAGASRSSLPWAIGGALLGMVLFPPLGIFIGAISGAIIGEMQNGKDLQQAAKAGLGVVVGSAMAVVLQLIYSLAAGAYFLVKIF